MLAEFCSNSYKIRHSSELTKSRSEKLGMQIVQEVDQNSDQVSISQGNFWNYQFFQNTNERLEKTILRAVRIFFSRVSFVFLKN